MLDNLTTTTVVTDCNTYTGRPRPTSAVAEKSFAIPQHTESALGLSVCDMPLVTNINTECDSGSEISEVGRARNISPTRDKLWPPNRPSAIRNHADSHASHRSIFSHNSKVSLKSGIPDINQLVQGMLQANSEQLQTSRQAEREVEKERLQAEQKLENKKNQQLADREAEQKRWEIEKQRQQAERDANEENAKKLKAR